MSTPDSAETPTGATPTAAEALRIALNVARNWGYAVFPVQDTKVPFEGSNGCHDGTRAPARIEALWRRWPGPLIGIACGAASGITVADWDIKHDHARDFWHRHCSKLPRTRTFRTRSGGIHLYFQYRPGIPNVVGRTTGSDPRPGIDVRNDGGYAIFWFAAGFECLVEAPVAPWPDWLLDAIRPPRPPAPAVPVREISGDAGKRLAALAKHVSGTREGSRNASLFWAACRAAEMVSAGQASAGEVESTLLAAADQCGLDRIAAGKTVASGLRLRSA